MAIEQLASLTLSVDERSELQSLTMRRKTAQALALRARIVLACAEGGQNKEVAAKLGSGPRDGGQMAAAVCPIAWRDFATNRAPGRRARSRMPASKR